MESFLVEIYRCKLCQFTCGLKASISSHLLLRHRPYLETTAEGEAITEDKEEAELQQDASPYRLNLDGESKQSEEDEDFLLYNMLDNMSPTTCDISSEGGLQVAHTCEVSTLFEDDSVALSCPLDPPTTQEEMAQSAHLMTLGLYRISTAKATGTVPRPVPAPADHTPQRSQPDSSRKQSETDGQTARCQLSCLLCPVTLASRRLLDIHVRSHQPSGGFSCIRCRWKVDSWEELEPHWRNHCRRRSRREEQKQEKKKKKRKKKERRRRDTSALCVTTSPNLQQTGDSSDGQRDSLIGQKEQQEADTTDRSASSPPSRYQISLSQCVTQHRKKKRIEREKTEEDQDLAFCCSLCHRKFSTKLTLRRHMGIHRGEKPFSCPHCPYSSRLKSSLLQHLRTHTGERPYRCSECSYASIDRSSLLRHCRTHSQEKPYRCQHCDYSSIQKKSLDLHARRHHTFESFPCQQCKYSSPDRQLLLRHVRKHHAPSQHASL